MLYRFDFLFFARGKFIRSFKWIYCRVFFIFNLIKINYYLIKLIQIFAHISNFFLLLFILKLINWNIRTYMFKRNQNFKSVIFKVFFTYLVVYLLALVFRYNNDVESLLNNIQYRYLIVLNIISIFLGLPLSIIFEFILIKFFGLYYVLFFSPSLTIFSFIQVLILRKINLRLLRRRYFFKKIENNYLLKLFKNLTFRSYYIIIIRSFPILPHILGSYIIASTKIKKKVILLNTFLGSVFYYIFLFLIISNVQCIFFFMDSKNYLSKFHTSFFLIFWQINL